MASEKTPLLIKSLKDEVVVKIPVDFDENNNHVPLTRALTYEELLPYIVDPYWIRIRKIIFTLTCTAFCVILLAACISSFRASSECRNTMLSASTDKVFVINKTTEEIPSGIASVILSVTEKLALVGG